MESRILLLVSVLTEELAHMQRAHEEDVACVYGSGLCGCRLRS